jgi:hypothetical protein
VDQQKSGADSPGMTPLGAVIAQAMEQRGMSTHEVQKRGGPSASTVGRLVSRNPKVDRRPPSDANLEKLARSLRLPLTRLQQAAAETRGWAITDRSLTSPMRTVIAAMGAMRPDAQTAVADITLIFAEQLRIAAGPDFYELLGAVEDSVEARRSMLRDVPPQPAEDTEPDRLAARRGHPENAPGEGEPS